MMRKHQTSNKIDLTEKSLTLSLKKENNITTGVFFSKSAFGQGDEEL